MHPLSQTRAYAWLFNPPPPMPSAAIAAPVEQAQPARLVIRHAPASAYDVAVNDAIVTHIGREGSRSLAQIGEVFLPAPAAGCNRDDERALKQRLTYLCAIGRLLRTVGSAHSARYHQPSTPV